MLWGTMAHPCTQLTEGKHDSLNQVKKLEEMNQKLSESKEGYVPVYYLDGLELVQQQK